MSHFEFLIKSEKILPYSIDCGDVSNEGSTMDIVVRRRAKRADIQDWCQKNCTGLFAQAGLGLLVGHRYWKFELKEDATLFALFFGGSSI